MAKSKVQFQKGCNLFEFLKGYGAEAQCKTCCSLGIVPHGFVCHELCQQDLLSPEKAATCLAMQLLPSSDVIDWKHIFCKH